MSKYFDMIHEQSHSTWTGGNVTKENFEEWVSHWFTSAEVVYERFVSEGLIDTAAFLRSLIDDCKERHYRVNR